MRIDFIPRAEHIESLVTDKTRAIVVINPNNPSGAVYDRQTLAEIVAIAEKHDLVILADEIYDQMVYDDAEFIPIATLNENAVCVTYSGLSKIYRACGYRVGWCCLSGDIEKASRLYSRHGVACGAAAVQQRAGPMGRADGAWRLPEHCRSGRARRSLVSIAAATILARTAESPFLDLSAPMGAMYAFVRLRKHFSSKLSDRRFALELLESKHVLVAPGSSFNTPYTDHFRITTLPDPETLGVVFDRIHELLEQHA